MFAEGVRAIAEPFLELPQAFASLTNSLVRDYFGNAQQAEIEPNMEMLTPVVEKLVKIGAIPPSENEGEAEQGEP